MLTVGLVLVALGVVVAAAVPRAREVGLVAAVVGGALIILRYVPEL